MAASSPLPETVAVEWLILADAAQVISNKLYLLGGGWDVLTVQRQMPIDHPFAIAISFRVPWTQTNQRHVMEFEVATEDGQVVLKGGGDFEVGRPPGLHPGQEQRFQLALSAMAKIEKAGVYTITCRIPDTSSEARTSFNVVVRPAIAAPPRP